MGHPCGKPSQFRQSLLMGEAHLLAEITNGFDDQRNLLSPSHDTHGCCIDFHIKSVFTLMTMMVDHFQRLRVLADFFYRTGQQVHRTG